VHAIAPPDPIEAILYMIESRGLSRRDLEPFLGNRARVSEILNRRRPLTLEMIRRLHYGLRIPAEVLIQPYSTI
jgi:HTH-type transcriptional regulator/antitoxin HigA